MILINYAIILVVWTLFGIDMFCCEDDESDDDYGDWLHFSCIQSSYASTYGSF